MVKQSSKDNDNNINNGTITVVHRFSGNKEKEENRFVSKKEGKKTKV